MAHALDVPKHNPTPPSPSTLNLETIEPTLYLESTLKWETFTLHWQIATSPSDVSMLRLVRTKHKRAHVGVHSETPDQSSHKEVYVTRDPKFYCESYHAACEILVGRTLFKVCKHYLISRSQTN